MSLIEEHRPSPWLGVLLGTTACFSGAALYDRACDGCNAQAETTMLIHFTDLNPALGDNTISFDCPHCVREGKPAAERDRVHVYRPNNAFTCGPEFSDATLEKNVEAGDWHGVVKNGVVGTIVPLQGNANIRGSAFLGL